MGQILSTQHWLEEERPQVRREELVGCGLLLVGELEVGQLVQLGAVPIARRGAYVAQHLVHRVSGRRDRVVTLGLQPRGEVAQHQVDVLDEVPEPLVLAQRREGSLPLE